MSAQRAPNQLSGAGKTQRRNSSNKNGVLALKGLPLTQPVPEHDAIPGFELQDGVKEIQRQTLNGKTDSWQLEGAQFTIRRH